MTVSKLKILGFKQTSPELTPTHVPKGTLLKNDSLEVDIKNIVPPEVPQPITRINA
jgi:hypothetical protein